MAVTVDQAPTLRTARARTTAPLLSLSHVRRTFGETIALDDCSISVLAGEIHALVGENGSGKSTLIKILSGILKPNAGEFLWHGSPLLLTSPWEAQERGIGTVFQETLVVEGLSILDNVMLGADQRILRRETPAAEEHVVAQILRRLGLDHLNRDVLVSELSLAQRQLISIARSLSRPWQLLILDESTSALDIEDRDRLFDVLREYRAEGRSILFVSHRMDEIATLADRATVLRSGRSVATLPIVEAPADRLLELMSSRKEADAAEGHGAHRKPRPPGSPLLALRGISLNRGAPAFDLFLHPGEILGVAGLEGHGQSHLMEAVAGLFRPAAGDIQCRASAIRFPRDARRSGVAYLPRDRKTEGIFAPLSVADNIMASSYGAVSRLGILNSRQFLSTASSFVASMRVKSQLLSSPISSLSGGNQQKVLLGRLLATKPTVLVLNDPMRGVDLGAKRDLYDALLRASEAGIGVLLLSTELIELCLLCDRVAVFHNGSVFRILERKALSEHSLIDAMFGRAAEAMR